MDLLNQQRALNRSSADHWELFRPHRERMTQLLLSVMPPGARVCVLGAGNSNDIDLARVAAAGAEIHLVDVDGEALRQAVTRYADARSALHIHAGVELTGALPELPSVAAPDDRAAMERWLERASAPPLPQLPGPFDVVLSACIATQLMSAAEGVLGERHPRLDDVVLALRAGHLRTLLGLTRRGGRALFVTELLSSDVMPELRDAPDPDLPALLFRAIMTRQIFKGLSPAGLVSWIVNERPYGARFIAPGITGPWRWWLTRRRAFLVVALLLEPTRDAVAQAQAAPALAAGLRNPSSNPTPDREAI
jgi:hypothetical protein